MANTEAIRSLLLALADDELIIGHRHSEWTGWAPHIEEDIAFSSIAQDEIGHANLFFNLIADLDGTSPDALAFGREPSGYRNAIICERPNGDWAYTLARHFLYESAETIRLESLSESSFKPLADASEKLLREERYHRLHADAWFDRLASGPVEARHQLAIALSSALPDALGLFEPFEHEDVAVDESIIPVRSDELMQVWLTDVVDRIEKAGIPFKLTPQDEAKEFLPTSSGELIGEAQADLSRFQLKRDSGRFVMDGEVPGWGGRRGMHSPDLQPLWDDLTKTYREEPTATW